MLSRAHMSWTTQDRVVATPLRLETSDWWSKAAELVAYISEWLPCVRYKQK
jgi:hypothetical protein